MRSTFDALPATVPAPRLVVSDLDGTLLRTDGSFSTRTVDVIEAVQAAGIGWIVATARPPRWMHDLLPLVGAAGVAICSNGAFVYDVARRTVVAERTLAAAALHELVRNLRAAVPDIAFAVERSTGFSREPGYVDVYREDEMDSVGAVDDLVAPLAGKLLARSSSLEPAPFIERVTEAVGNSGVVAYSGATGLAEISAAGVTKAAVLDDLCHDRGIAPSEVWAFGDMPNDLAMLDWAGTSFAVANAHPDVLAQADFVVASNDEDGVAGQLEALITRLASR